MKLPKNKFHLVALLVVLILAAFLRLYRIDLLMRFIWDEGRDMLAVHKIIVDKDVTLFGPFNEIGGSKDFFGVFHYYLMLPALWLFSFDPIGPAIWTALLGVMAVGLAYFWLSLWQKKSVALCVSLLMAVSPLVVRYNQWPWNPNTIGFFMMAYLIFIYFYQNRMRKWLWALLAGLMLGLLLQLHYFAVAGGVIGLAIFLKQKNKRWLDAILFISSAVLPNLTFVIFDLTHEGFYSKILLESFSGQSGQNLVDFSIAGIVLGPAWYLMDISVKLINLKVFGILLFFIFLWWMKDVIRQSIKKYKESDYVSEDLQLVLSWLVFLVGTSIFPSLLDDYHSAALWVGVFVALVLFLQKRFQKIWLPFLLVLAGWMFLANRFWREPSWMENMPILREVGFVIADDAKRLEEKQANIASFVDSDTKGVRFRYFIKTKGVQLLSADQYPEAKVLYAITPHNWEETILNPAWELETFKKASVSGIWERDGWRIFRVEK